MLTSHSSALHDFRSLHFQSMPSFYLHSYILSLFMRNFPTKISTWSFHFSIAISSSSLSFIHSQELKVLFYPYASFNYLLFFLQHQHLGALLTPLDASLSVGSVVNYYNIAPIILDAFTHLAFFQVHHANPKL